VRRIAQRPGEARRYWLPAEHVNVLVAEDHPAHLAPLAQMVAGIGGALERVVNAYRSGGGVAYPHFGAAFRAGHAGINRPAFLTDLVTRWIPAMPDLHSALTSTRMRVADVGCGAGWSTLAMARAFPRAEHVGFDADPASVYDAQRNAAAQGLALGRQGKEQLATEGVEGGGGGIVTRIVTGGAGNYAGWVGEQRQTFLGFNETGGVNLRVTFILRPPAK
jgi:hypothetical protein